MTCCQHITHTASGRTGRIVSTERRYRVDGAWVVWDQPSPRPTWHPIKVLAPVSPPLAPIKEIP